MNKFINILLLLILFPVILLAIVIGFDIPVELIKLSGANFPYKLEAFAAFATLIFVIGLRRAIRRWTGLKMVNQTERFQWNQAMAKSRYNQCLLYLILESFIHFFIAFALISLTDFAWPVALALSLLGIDHLLFAALGSKKQLYRVGITSKAILVADRDLKAIYFQGLRRVTKHQQSLFFDYKDDLQIAFPSDCISLADKESFKSAVMSNVDRDKVFFDENFKNF